MSDTARIVGTAIGIVILAICCGAWAVTGPPTRSVASLAVNVASAPPGATVPETDVALEPLPPAVLGPVLGDGKGEHDYPGPQP